MEFGDVGATRMCTSSEILNTATVPQGLVGPAWVRPVWQHDTSAGQLDDSGVRGDSGQLTCYSGTLSGFNASGLTVGENGSFEVLPCETPRPIACCHPVVVPEPSASLGLSTGVFALLALNATRG